VAPGVAATLASPVPRLDVLVPAVGELLLSPVPRFTLPVPLAFAFALPVVEAEKFPFPAMDEVASVSVVPEAFRLGFPFVMPPEAEEVPEDIASWSAVTLPPEDFTAAPELDEPDELEPTLTVCA